MNMARRVIGYAISHLLDTRLCLAALDAALDLRQPRAGVADDTAVVKPNV